MWLLVIVVVAAIYATLGMASTLAGRVNEQLLVAAFASGLGLTALAILTQGLRVRPGGLELGIVVGLSLICLMFIVRLALAERSHLMEYSVVAFLIYEALAERVRQGRAVRFYGAWAIILTSLIGMLDECIQLFLPSRVFDWYDILFNILAATVAILMVSGLHWIVEARSNKRR